MKKAFILTAAALMAAGSLAGSAAATPNSTASRDAIAQRPQAPRPVSIRNDFSGGENPYKYYRKGPRNQK